MGSIGERIKKIRVDANLNQEQFAKKISVSRSFISRVENGKETPSDTLVKLISSFFERNYEWVKDGVGKEYRPFKEDNIKRQRIMKSDLMPMLAEKNTDPFIKLDYAKIIQDIASFLFDNGALMGSERYFSYSLYSFIGDLSSYLKLRISLIRTGEADEYADEVEKDKIDLMGKLSDYIDEMVRCLYEENLDEILEKKYSDD